MSKPKSKPAPLTIAQPKPELAETLPLDPETVAWLVSSEKIRTCAFAVENLRLEAQLASLRAEQTINAGRASFRQAQEHNEQCKKSAEDAHGVDLASYHYQPGDTCLRRNKAN